MKLKKHLCVLSVLLLLLSSLSIIVVNPARADNELKAEGESKIETEHFVIDYPKGYR